MASSGNFSTNKYSTSSHGTIGLNLSWSIQSQSIQNNTSTIKWTLKSNGTMSSGYYVQAGPVTVVIGGKTVLNTKSRFNMRGGGGYSESGTITIAHSEDGSKSVSMSVKAAIYSASVNCTGSKSYTLTKINRCALINSATDFNDEGNPTITYSNPAGGDLVSGIMARLKWLNADGVTEETTDWSDQLSDEGGTYTFDLDSYRNALRAACPGSNSLSVTVDLKSTMSGTEYHDTKVIQMSIVNAAPQAGAVTFEDTNSAVSGVTGDDQIDDQIIVQGQSTLHIVTAVSTALKGASISSYVINFNGVNYDITSDRYLDIIKPPYSGTFVATVTTTDSRGNTATATATIVITPWAAPSADCTAERVNGFETNTVLTVDGTISTVTGSSMTISERHRKVGDSWIGPNPVTDNTPTTLSLDYTDEWEIEVSVSDSFTTSTPTVYVLPVGKGIPPAFVDVDLNSLGVNGFPDDNDQLFVGGNGHIKVEDAPNSGAVILPHKYSSTPQIVGYWTDGRAIWEETIDLSSSVTINANAWNNSVYTFDTAVTVLNAEVYYIDSQAGVINHWAFMASGTSSDGLKLWLYNPRDASCVVTRIVVRYLKPST